MNTAVYWACAWPPLHMAQVQREKRLHCAAHVASVSAITIRTSGTLEPFTTDPEQGFNCSHSMYIYIYISLSLSLPTWRFPKMGVPPNHWLGDPTLPPYLNGSSVQLRSRFKLLRRLPSMHQLLPTWPPQAIPDVFSYGIATDPSVNYYDHYNKKLLCNHYTLWFYHHFKFDFICLNNDHSVCWNISINPTSESHLVPPR